MKRASYGTLGELQYMECRLINRNMLRKIYFVIVSARSIYVDITYLYFGNVFIFQISQFDVHRWSA